VSNGETDAPNSNLGSGWAMRRFSGVGVVACVVAVATLLAGGLAWADEALADGDGLTPVANNALSFGDVCAGTTVSKSALFAIERSQGGANTFKNGTGAAVTVAVGPGGTGSVSATLPALVGGSNFTVPANWEALANGTRSDPITSTVTFVAGAPGVNLNRTLTYTITGTPSSGSGNLVRTTPVTVTASVISCDTTPPTLNLPSNQTVEATGPTGRTVTYTATATDAAPPNPSVSCTPASGSAFPLGTTTVSCSSTDAAGNTAHGSFSITVQDTTAPSFGPVTNVTAEATGPTGAVVTFTDPTATDLVDGTRPVTCAPTSGSTFPLGPSTVTCSASDTRGNTGSTSFTVTVSDTSDPTLVLPTSVTEEATGPDGAPVDFDELVSASDTVDPAVAVECDPASGSTFGLGTTSVACQATDASGNSSTGSFDVIVQDTTAPAVSVPAPFTEEATTAAGATVTYSATASDLVDGVLTPSCSVPSGSTFPIGVTTVVCSATDVAGNSESEQFTVTVVDTTAPELTLPPDVLEEADQLGGKVVTFAATATDVVDGTVTVACGWTSGSLFPVGTTEVTCTASDARENTAQGSFLVTITDTTAPVVTVPDDLTLEAAGADGAVAEFADDVSASDVVDGDLAVSCDPASGSTFGLGTTTVTCTATDAAGNAGSESFDVTVVDTTPPVISGTPGDFTVEATGPDGATATYTAPTASDLVDGVVAVTCEPPSGALFPLDVATVVTCTATDSTGNSSTSTFTVLVSDTTAPVLAVPGDITEEATGPDGATVTYAVTASDTVDGDVPVTCVPPSGSTFALGTVEVGCTATDSSANTGSGAFKVTVVDTTPPVLTVPDDLTAEATGPAGAAVDFAATAVDLVDGAVTVTCEPASGSTFPLGDTEVTCSATDAALNTATDSFPVTVVDTTAPVLTLPGDLVVEATSSTGATVGFTATATDAVDGPVLVTCVPPAGVFPLGTTPVTCSATDAADNTATGGFDVTVQDTTAPVVTVPEDITAEATSASGAAVTFTSSSTDAVDGLGTPSCTPSSASTFALGATPVTCSITDGAGNTGSASFTVTVVDTTGPAISDTPTDLTREATGPDGAIVTYANPTAVDLVDGTVSVTCAPPSGSTFALDATTPVDCTAADSRGNTSSSQFQVTVQDTTAPTLTVPASFTREATGPAGAAVTFTTNADDAVDGTVAVVCVPPSGSTFGFGPTPVDCSATDAHDNTAEGSFTVTVVDTTAPVLTMSPDLVVEATGPSGAAATFTNTATDVVDGAVVPSCDATSGDTFPLGVTTVSCTATDAAGNSSSGSFTVTVQDTTAPTLHLPSDLTRTATGASGAPVTYTASATDAVAGSPAVTCAPPSGTTFAPGAQTVSCFATDGHGNTASGSFVVTVVFDLSGGLLQPVNANVLNTVKGGSTVPLKFQVRTASGGYVSSLSVVSSFVLTQVQCTSLSTAVEEVDFTTTGGTSLRYDTGSNQYHQNWQTPKKPGTCYRVDVVLTGGLQRLSATFQLK
jgi:hypothetical protein